MILLLGLWLPLAVHAQDRRELGGDTITGNKEAPKALFIVPWKSLDASEISGFQVETRLQDELQLLDPETLRREIQFSRVRKKIISGTEE